MTLPPVFRACSEQERLLAPSRNLYTQKTTAKLFSKYIINAL
jgi:hypothetical protein